MNLSVLPAMLAMIPAVCAGVGMRELERIKVIARRAYPAVPQLDTETLAGWMVAPQPPLLIDVRSTKEYAVSHLQGAVNLQKAEQIAAAIQTHRPGRTVLYCSVGFRSSRLADILAAKGATNLWNLEGSIFQWVNEGRPIYCGEMAAQQVHPYGRRWAGLLKPGLASEC